MRTDSGTAGAAIQVRGTAFVEWAGPSAELVQTLEAVGFRLAARHRTKDIALMTQGEIRFLVNAEPGSHASRFAREHGPSCAGMAFLVDDSADAMRCAGERDASRLHESEQSLLPAAALSGIGGSALYLADRSSLEALWAQFDFLAAGASDAREPSQLCRVDHLTHCVRPGAMAEWVDFYKRLFGFEEVFKFVAGDREERLRHHRRPRPRNNACVTVLEPMGAKSQIQEFIDEYRGEGIQHLALLSDDLYASVVAMRERGVEFLPTPDAYYDAVDERMPGHGEDVARLQALGMLMDGASTGENPDDRRACCCRSSRGR